MKYSVLFILLSIFVFALSYAGEIQKENPVKPQQLYQLIEVADRLIVKESPLQDAKVLFESTDRKDLDAFQSSLVIEKPKEWFHCMCIGTPAIYLYKGEKELGLLTNHHGISVRFSLWSSDAPIIDTEKWLLWFDERSIPGPRKEVEEMRVQRGKSENDLDRWLAAMPQSITPLWADSLRQYGEVNIAPLSKALRAEIQDKNQLILALLEWFGSGAGPWSGYPSYESAAEEILIEYDTEDIVAAIESTKLTNMQTEGAARLFGGWSFSQKRPNGLLQLPDTLKGVFWNHVNSTQDKDKLTRAKRTKRGQTYLTMNSTRTLTAPCSFPVPSIQKATER